MQRLAHVVGVAAGGAHEVMRRVMHVVEVEVGGQRGVGRAGEEVQAAVKGQNRVALLDDGGNGREHEHIVVALAVGQAHQRLHRVLAGVGVDQLHAVLRSFVHRVDGSRAIQAVLVDVGHDQQAGLAVAVDGVVDGAQTHGARAGQNRHVAALADAHLMDIAAGLGVILGVEGADDAAQRLGQRAIEELLGLVVQQAVLLHDLGQQDGMLRIAAAVLEGIARGHERALVGDGGLDGELLAHGELVGPLRADLLDQAAELVADDGGMLADIVGDALVVGALKRSLVAGHADGVRDDLDENFIVLDLRKLKGIEAQIILPVHTYSLIQHVIVLL